MFHLAEIKTQCRLQADRLHALFSSRATGLRAAVVMVLASWRLIDLASRSTQSLHPAETRSNALRLSSSQRW
jgi:hypothetical protein